MTFPKLQIKYDMVVSSFTLMELPNQRSRVQVVENLWNKTQDLLVLVEHGSSAGFRTILEARNLILTLNGYDVTKSYYNDPNDVSIVNYDPENAPTAHIMAPVSCYSLRLKLMWPLLSVHITFHVREITSVVQLCATWKFHLLLWI